jgi:hypothetical protein
MKKILILLFLIGMSGFIMINAQTKAHANHTLKVSVYYFHPNERCPIDQSIEKNSIIVMNSFFLKEISNGTLKFQVLNTDDKANAKVASKFDINAQALYIVKTDKGKEVQKDITRFAFDYGQSNPGKFKAGLKEEIEKVLK